MTDDYTTDEAQTATLAYTEGTPYCMKVGKYTYPRLRIAMCVKEGLEAAQRTFGRTIFPETHKKIACKPEDFPPEGKGRWIFDLRIDEIEKLSPLIPKPFLEKWNKKWTQKGCKPRPIRKYKKRKKFH